MKILKKEGMFKVIVTICALTIAFSVFLSFMLIVQYRSYNKEVNNAMGSMVDTIISNYPEIEEEEIIESLNSTSNGKSNILNKYGYDNQTQIIAKNGVKMQLYICIDVFIFILFSAFTLYFYVRYANKKDEKLDQINQYIREVNNKNYTLDISDNGEGELSKLKNEIYKITVALKENAEISKKEKEQLSNVITDISHQLKTPLTSIRIMLDNIEENLDMDKQTKDDFIKEISKQVDWISSLVVSLLKLAKFDAGAIVMDRKEIDINKLTDNILNNLAILLDIKNIEVEKEIPENAKILGDYKWELEALTNVIKNAIEHSREDSKIHIKVEDNSLFLKISIIDEGEGIGKEDIKHVFDRFYKSKNSSENSIGVGLSLAKSIIEKDNGYISVDSELKVGTTFEIKYMR